MNNTIPKEDRSRTAVVSTCDDDTVNVYDLCRLCMSEECSTTKMMQITDTYPAGSNYSISAMIVDCLSIDVEDEVSNMLTQVCEDCVVDLYTFSDFKKRCNAVNRQLRHIIIRNHKISQAQALYGQEIVDISCDSDPQEEDQTAACTILSVPLNIGQSSDKAASGATEISSIEGIAITVDVEGNIQLSSDSREEEARAQACDSGNSALSTCLADHSSNRMENEIFLAKNNEDTHTEPLNNIEVYAEDVGEDEQDPDEEVEIHVSLDGESNVVKVVGKVPSSGLYREESTPKAHAKPKQSYLSKQPGGIPIPEVLIVMNEEGQKQLAFRCQECGKTFNNKILHRGHVATHISQKGYVCQYCDKWFPVKSALARHERIHSGEKPHTCILCNRSFSQKEILQRHVLTHTDSKPFPCPHCDKGYTQKEALNVHMKNTHEEHRTVLQYPCPLCDKAFCHPSGLSRHMQSHTGKRYHCDICNQHFSDRSSLRRHQRKIHSCLDVSSSGDKKSVLPTNADESYYQLLHEPF